MSRGSLKDEAPKHHPVHNHAGSAEGGYSELTLNARRGVISQPRARDCDVYELDANCQQQTNLHCALTTRKALDLTVKRGALPERADAADKTCIVELEHVNAIE